MEANVKGVVFNLLEEFVVTRFGHETWLKVLALCPAQAKEVFVGPGTYPDGDLFALAHRTADVLGLPLPDALRAFGRFAFPHLAERLPGLLETHRDPQSLLLALDGVIHVEVRKFMKGAATPRFFLTPGRGKLHMRYESRRGLCSFLEGLLDGLGDAYDTDIHFEHVRCTHRGDLACELDLSFHPRSRAEAHAA
jgi:hypothetical protein